VRYALAAALLAVVAGCGGGGDKSAATTGATTVVTTTGASDTLTVTTHGRYHYPRAYINNFMQTCTKNRKRAYCACTLDKLSNNVSNKDLARIAASGGKVPPRVQRLIKQAANACRDKF
jgi:ABC-type glycerol-3-phosphate transport system substrate-binding protein